MKIHSNDELRSFWKISELEEILSEIEACVEKMLQEKSMIIQSDIEYIVLGILQKALVTTREIVCLVCGGFPDGAMSLARNLYEQFVIISFFNMKMKDSNLKNFVDDYLLSAKRAALNIQRSFLENDSSNEDDFSSVNEELENIKVQFHSKGGGTYRWAGVNSFKDLVDVLLEYNKNDAAYFHFLTIQHLNYKNACTLLHAGALGNIVRLGKSNIDVIDVGPHPECCGYPLCFTTYSLIGIVGATLQICGIDGKAIVGGLNKLAGYYQQTDCQ